MKIILFLLFFYLFCHVKGQGQVEIYFKVNQFTLSDSAKAVLDNWYTIFPDTTERYATQYYITGFADPAGDSIYNKELSRKRAETVYNYLAAKSGKGYIPLILKHVFWSWIVQGCDINHILDIVYEEVPHPFIYKGYGELAEADGINNKRVVIYAHPEISCGGDFGTCDLPEKDTALFSNDRWKINFPRGSINSRTDRGRTPACDSTFSMELPVIKTDSGEHACYFYEKFKVELKIDIVPDIYTRTYCDDNQNRLSEGNYVFPGSYLTIPAGDSTIVQRKPARNSFDRTDTIITSGSAKRGRFSHQENTISVPLSWLYMDSVYVTQYTRISTPRIKSYLVKLKNKKDLVITYDDGCQKNMQAQFVRKAGLFRTKRIYRIRSGYSRDNISINVQSRKGTSTRQLGDLKRKKRAYLFK